MKCYPQILLKTHWHHDTFRVHWEAQWRGTAPVTFAIDEAGRPSTLKIGDYGFTRETKGESK
jgi:hypothetical protein